MNFRSKTGESAEIRGLNLKVSSESREYAEAILNGILSVLFTVCICGSLGSMASISGIWLAPALPGILISFAIPLFSGRRPHIIIPLCSIAAALILTVIFHDMTFNGVGTVANRLFAASEASQNYIYDKVNVSFRTGSQTACLRLAAFEFSLICGSFAGFFYGSLPVWVRPVLFLPLCILEAWLGVAPGEAWIILTGAAVILSLLPCKDRGRTAAFAITVYVIAVCCILVYVFCPGEDAVMSVWEEKARDFLAVNPVYYGSYNQYDQEEITTEISSTEEISEYGYEDDSETEGEAETDGKIFILCIILLLAAILFIPAILGDRAKKKREARRAGLTAEDNKEAVRWCFIYAMEWLYRSGLSRENLPYSAYERSVMEKFPELSDKYGEAVRLWQEAEYSNHSIDSDKRVKMEEFQGLACRVAWNKMNRRQHFIIKYISCL